MAEAIYLNMNITNNQLIKELGLEALPEEEKKRFLKEVAGIISQTVILRMVDMLSEPDKDELEILLEKNQESPDKTAMDFFEKKIPNLPDIVNEEIKKFKEEGKEFLAKVA